MHLRVNTVLCTKDGRAIGNAIIVKVLDCRQFQTLYELRTDYGHDLRLTYKEVHRLFYVVGRASRSHKNYVSKKLRRK